MVGILSSESVAYYSILSKCGFWKIIYDLRTNTQYYTPVGILIIKNTSELIRLISPVARRRLHVDVYYIYLLVDTYGT
eukprot:SAG11_NODE_735_length_7452_cov_26.426629_1_plen_78_part_00